MFKFNKPKPLSTDTSAPMPQRSYFSTHAYDRIEPVVGLGLDDVLSTLKHSQPIFHGEFALDDSSNGIANFKGYDQGSTTLSDTLALWYASQSFIGHQLCGILAQHWLINKACTMPVDDAIRNGFNIVTTNGEELDGNILGSIKQADRRFKLKAHLREFLRKGRIFGIRIAMFKVESTDPDYYKKPFNLDGITPNSYKGIVQLDPYWTAPMLDQASASQPDSLHFYEPTYWLINGKQVHRTHLIIYRHAELIDILKPQYLYGGIPLPQMIMERVYAAERTANEAPQLLQTKRTNVWLTDMEKVMADSTSAAHRLQEWTRFRDNYGIKLGDKDGDQFQQFDTTLGDVDAVIMAQYQIVAAIAQIPATRLLGSSPKGFGASGNYEIASYHESLESMQEHDLTPLIERHHELVMRSCVGLDLDNIIETTINWNPIDTLTAKDQAEVNLIKAQTGDALIKSGAITAQDEHQRIALDQASGYHGLGITDVTATVGQDAGGGNPCHDPQTGRFTSGCSGGATTASSSPTHPTATSTVTSNEANELSGSQWAGRFPESVSTNDLTPTFKTSVDNFINAIKAAGVIVHISTTYRSSERAYLMHYSGLVAEGRISPAAVPHMQGVNIEWDHGNPQDSRRAAQQLFHSYGIAYPAALVSRHTQRRAIDMTIPDSILGKTVVDANGIPVRINTMSKLYAVGASYGVIKLVRDHPHWSDDGH